VERADVRTPASPTPPAGRTVRHPSPKEYVRIAVVLAVVTAMEVGIYYAEISRALLIPALLIFAAIKFVLVVLWYMHLRFDSRTYARFFMIGLAGAVTLYLVVLLTFRAFSG
jgi:cytochrome c oxidase subunit 4